MTAGPAGVLASLALSWAISNAAAQDADSVYAETGGCETGGGTAKRSVQWPPSARGSGAA